VTDYYVDEVTGELIPEEELDQYEFQSPQSADEGQAYDPIAEAEQIRRESLQLDEGSDWLNDSFLKYPLAAASTIAKGAGGLIQGGEELFGTGTTYGADTVRDAEDVFQAIRNRAEQSGDSTLPLDFSAGIGGAYPLVAGAVTGAGLPAILAGGAGQIFGERYGNFRGQEVEPLEAAGGAATSAAFNTGLNALPFYRLLRPGAGPIARGTEAAISGAATGRIGAAADIGIEEGLTGNILTDEQFEEAKNRATLLGAGTNLLTSGVVSAKQSFSNRASRPQVQAQAEADTRALMEQQAAADSAPTQPGAEVPVAAGERQSFGDLTVPPDMESMPVDTGFRAEVPTMSRQPGGMPKFDPPAPPSDQFSVASPYDSPANYPVVQPGNNQLARVPNDPNFTMQDPPARQDFTVASEFNNPALLPVPRPQTAPAVIPKPPVTQDFAVSSPLYEPQGFSVSSPLGRNLPAVRKQSLPPAVMPRSIDPGVVETTPVVRNGPAPKVRATVEDSGQLAMGFLDNVGKRFTSERGWIKAGEAFNKVFGKAADEVHTDAGLDSIVKAHEEIRGQQFKRMPKGSFEEITLPKGERFARGLDAKALGIPLDTISPGIAGLRKYAYVPRAIGRNDPRFAPAPEAVHRIGFKKVNTMAAELVQQADDYFSLPDKTKVNRVLAVADEMGDRWRPTDQTLAQHKLSPEEIKAFWAYRNTMDLSWNMLGNALHRQGHQAADVAKYLDELKVSNYIPRSRFGDFYTFAKDADGNIANYSFYKSKAEAVAAGRALEAEGFATKIGEVDRPSQEALELLPFDLRTALGKLDPDAATELSKEIPVTGFRGHLVHRKGIAGYELDLEKSLADYVQGISRYVGQQELKPILDKVVKDLEGSREMQAYAIRYRDSVLKAGDDFAKTRAFLAAYYMAMSPANAAQNLSTMLTTTAPGVLGRVKSIPKTARIFLDAQKDTAKFLTGTLRDKRLLAALKAEEKTGNLGDSVMRDLAMLKGSETRYQNFINRAMVLQRVTDKYSRLNAYIAGWKVANDPVIAKEAGLSDDFARMKYASEFLDDVQFIPGKSNRPEMMRGKGSIPFLFKQWPWQSLDFLAKHGGRTAGASLLAMWALAGVRGLPYTRDFFKFAEQAGWDIDKDVREAIGEVPGKALLRGPIREVTGIDLGNTMGAGEVLPGLDKNPYVALGKFVGGPGADLLNRPFRAWELYKDYDDPYRAIETVMPRSIRNAMTGIRGYREGFRMPNGDPIMDNVTPGQAFTSGMGWAPAPLTDKYQERFTKNTLDEVKADSDNIYFRLSKALTNKDWDRVNEIKAEATERGIDLRKKKGVVKGHLKRMAGAD
jgi:hypothetical protein